MRQQKTKLSRQVREKEEELDEQRVKSENLRQELRKADKAKREVQWRHKRTHFNFMITFGFGVFFVAADDSGRDASGSDERAEVARVQWRHDPEAGAGVG